MTKLLPRLVPIVATWSVALLAAISPASNHAADSAKQAAFPRLVFTDQRFQDTLGEAYRQALHNLLETNSIPADLKKYNRTGLLTGTPPKLIRAGGDYQDPWTRDASVNSWNAASLLCPEVARNTLWAVCERLPDGRLIIQRDNQWWDKLIWVTAAWNHYATTGDAPFLAAAYEAAKSSLDEMRRTRFDREFGLFQGPSHLADGIAGYPEPFNDPKGSSSFILDHPGSDRMMTLSANCISYHALRCAAQMALALKQDPAVVVQWNRQAEELKAAINRHLWMADKNSFAYFLHGAGDLRGTQAKYQEATGLALAVLFGLREAGQDRRLVQSVRTTQFGIPLVDPDFSRYSPDQPSRHGRIVWPMAMGYWATAAAKAGEIELFRKEVEALASLVKASGWNFLEIYSPTTGQPDGGWQCGAHWRSCKHQTWSATAFLRMIHQGLCGMRFEPDGIRFAPTLPAAWGTVRLEGVRYRNLTLDVQLTGQGRRVGSFTLDGRPVPEPFLPATLTGHHALVIPLAGG